LLDPDPDPRRQKLPTKIGEKFEFSCFEVLDVLFCGLKASPAVRVADPDPDPGGQKLPKK
jgi:hypothetical protein